MNEIYTWWDDAVRAAHTLATQTRMRHRVTAVYEVDGTIHGWTVDLTEDEYRAARELVDDAIDAEFWALIETLEGNARPAQLIPDSLWDACIEDDQ